MLFLKDLLVASCTWMGTAAWQTVEHKWSQSHAERFAMFEYPLACTMT